MNLALDHYADNPIVDELVFWPPKSHRIMSVRACSSMFRKPFIEVELEDGDIFHRHFARDTFAQFWAEACVILDTLTRIELVSDFSFTPLAQAEKLQQQVLASRDECIEESNLMYDQGMYAPFLMQYGEDCKNLPADTLQKIAHAKGQLKLAK
ncbi:MAG: hypothetical protein GY802_21775 [Gammaproteobacteria bacterium]|nr:hypothetical protein [Gammaproteobacteria bacterium]